MEKTPAAMEAARVPPSCLQSFVCTVRPAKPGDLDLAVDFDLTCRTCGAAAFKILCYPKIAPDPSPYSEVESGQIFFRPPYHLQCAACCQKAPLFDVRTQGYDAVLNDCANYESGDDSEGGDQEGRPSGTFRMTVSFCYNAELEELSEMASKAGVIMSDLFDWISITGVPLSGGDAFEEGYECA